MSEYYLKIIYFSKNSRYLPLCIIDIILQYLPSYKYKDDIKKGNYIKNGLWYKRIISRSIMDISRDQLSYFDWYKIFHYKDYHMLIKFENQNVQELLKTKSIEEINKIHMENLENCHLKNHMSFRF